MGGNLIEQKVTDQPKEDTFTFLGVEGTGEETRRVPEINSRDFLSEPDLYVCLAFNHVSISQTNSGEERRGIDFEERVECPFKMNAEILPLTIRMARKC